MSKTFTPVFNAYRFYADGTESGSTPLQNENVDTSIDVTAGNVIFHLRVRIQESGGAAGATTDDWRLQASRNGGAYGDFDAQVGMDANSASGLVNGSATTNRATGITDGSGSFVAGKQSDLGATISNHQLTASGFTEHVWAIFVRTDLGDELADGDTFDFRITLNGGAPGMTNSVTPRVTIVLDSGATQPYYHRTGGVPGMRIGRPGTIFGRSW